MAFGRYVLDNYSPDGLGLSQAKSVIILRRAISLGTVSIVQQVITTQADRLDNISGIVYGDSRYWWVLAAASNVGWGMQLPPGIIVNVPNLKEVERVVG